MTTKVTLALFIAKFFGGKTISHILVHYYNFFTMQEGTVKFFNETKGFGFITPSNGGQDIFVHISGLTSGVTLNEKDRVMFDVQDGKKGLNAVNVRLA
jgi:CspA family cold shock protein